MKYFSTFSGIGGFEIGIQNAYREAIRRSQSYQTTDDEARQGLVATQGEDSSASERRASTSASDQSDEGPLCVGYSEIDKYASSVYEHNFPGVKNYGDITKINAQELPDFDCLVGGFPCQAFSIAGKRRGFEDTRGTLFFDLARILREKQPRYFVFENVKGLLSHDQGNTFRTIIAATDELGYDVQWQVLNSKNFGVPQNRERVYIVGHLRGTPRPEVFPLGQDDRKASDIQGHYTNTLTARYEGAQATGSYIANTISTGSTHTVGTYVGESKLDAQKVKSAATRTRAYAGKSETLEIRKDDVSNTINSVSKDYYATDMVRIRRLTPKECERLQGFPDDWTKESTNGSVSDTQRYKMCGNAVTTNVVQAVMERIFANE